MLRRPDLSCRAPCLPYGTGRKVVSGATLWRGGCLSPNMQTTQELNRRPSPATRPHPLAFAGGLLWMGSWDTDRVYAIDPRSWSVQHEIESPGKPYGLTAYGDELR